MNDLKKSTKNPLQAVDINNNNTKNVSVELPNVPSTDQSNTKKKNSGAQYKSFFVTTIESVLALRPLCPCLQ